ncbi:MAG: Lrp/AsnC family transcriptional regulator [Proteobacteria bacterium]|nr:Lrp/AsnC family transcriptional regulator [Pseudomonadota bacterium]
MITKQQYQLLSLLHLDAHKPIKEVSRALKMKEYNVRYQLDCLKADEVISGSQIFVNTYALGYCQYEVYVSLGINSESQKSKFINYLLTSERVPWIGEFAGTYQYGFTVCCRNVFDLNKFLEDLSLKFENIIFNLSVLTRISYSEFPIKKYSSLEYSPNYLKFGIVPQLQNIDILDHQILKNLSKNNSIKLIELADELKISNQTIHQRLAKLKQKQIIVGSTLLFKIEKLNLHVYKIFLKVKIPNPKLKKQIFNYALAKEGFLYFIECLGAWDIEIGVAVTDANEISAVCQHLLDKFGDKISLVNFLITSKYIKAERYPFEELVTVHGES